MHIWLRGWAARAFLIVCAIFGFLAGLATVLDYYDAYWQITVPATLVYAALLYVFATPKAEPDDKPLAVVFTKLLVTVLWIALSFGAIAAVIWLCKLVADNWPYVVIAAVIVVGIVLWAMISAWFDDRKTRREKVQLGREDAPPLTPPEGHAG
jgi:bacteriorhodopsin